MRFPLPSLALLIVTAVCSDAASAIRGRTSDPQGKVIAGARIRLQTENASRSKEVRTNNQGQYQFESLAPGRYIVSAEAAGLAAVTRSVALVPGEAAVVDLAFTELEKRTQSLVITSSTMEPAIDLRNAEVFNRTLFTRDDHVLEQLNAGINAGQHEGGGKSLEIRRFGFNLDHGGVNGGLKVLVDNVQQNQGTQGHGQGYLGALKALSPELIQDVTIVNGPFSAEYGDFSGLGVVHIRQRESLPDQLTMRVQGGNFDTGRGFLAFSPDTHKIDAYFAYEGSYTNGPFLNPGQYRRDNINANFTKSLSDEQKIGFRLLFARNNFNSSGQLPLDLVTAGQLDRFGYTDPSDGGRVKLGTISSYYSKSFKNGDTFKADAFLARSLFDLYSNFTFYLNDPVMGDAFQQHDSRFQQGANSQYTHAHKIGGLSAMLVSGLNFHDNEINVGLYPREGRVPTGVTTRANAHVTNGAGYIQETARLWGDRLLIGGGLRYDYFRFNVADRVEPESGGVQSAGRWQGKGNIAFTPSKSLPITLHANYGRGINSIDARGVVQRPDLPRVAATDFYQTGVSSKFSRFSLSADAFLIDHSNEQVYIPDDGSFEFKGPSRAYGYETKASVSLSRHFSFNGGLTKIGNAFYKGGDHRVYVDSAPHFVANAAITMAGYHGWSGSLRMRAINHYRLNGDDPSIVASGHTVFDLGLSRQIRRGIEFNIGMDNLTSRDYYETQNYFDSRVSPLAPVVGRIHGTPGYPLHVVAGVTFRLRGK